MLVADVIQATIAVSGLSRTELMGPSHARVYARPRQVGMYLSYRLTSADHAKISRMWNGRDRTTTRHAVARIDDLIARGDEDVIAMIKAMLAHLGLDALPETRPVVIARPLLLSRIAARERELRQLRADLAALDRMAAMTQEGAHP